MYQRIAEFLHILGYQCSFDMEFQQGTASWCNSRPCPFLTARGCCHCSQLCGSASAVHALSISRRVRHMDGHAGLSLGAALQLRVYSAHLAGGRGAHVH